MTKIFQPPKTYKLAVILNLIVSFFVLNSNIVNAQVLNNNSLSLGFAPTSSYLTLKPGDTYKGEVVVWNLSPVKRTYSIIPRGFEQIENFPGTARVHTLEEEARDPFTAGSWIKIPYKKVELLSNQNFKIPYEINVPADSASGEYHAMIFMLSDATTFNIGFNSGSISPLGSGPVILIKVGDKIIEKAEIEYFKSEKSFYELPPVTFLTRYLNKSNTHITPTGEIIIENFLGQEIDKITFNENRQSLLRGNAGNYSDIWDPKSIFLHNGKLAIGPMKARLITTYMSVNPGYAPLNAVANYWVLPWKLILVILILLGIMYRFIKYIYSKYVKKESHSINTDNYPFSN